MNRKDLLKIPALAADRNGSTIRIILTYNIKSKMVVFFTAGKCCFSKKQLFSGVSCFGSHSGDITLALTLQALDLMNRR